jgi:hypothetical protein
MKLTFGKGNAKLHGGIATFSLPAGYSCPFADKCLAKADRETGRVQDGANQEFRCFSASAEAVFAIVRNSRWHNFETLKGRTTEEMTEILAKNISLVREPLIRIHVSGDFFSQDYFDAWLNVAKMFPRKVFYAYTKSIPFWIARMGENPKNFRLIASEGGKYDELIKKFNLKSAKVVYSEADAKRQGLKIDEDDSLASGKSQKSFALLLHGTQKAGTLAAKALSALFAEGKTGYGNGSYFKRKGANE